MPYYTGFTIILVCLVVQHTLARKQDPVSLNAAFFRMNAVISAVFLGGVVVDAVWR
jgi:4-hydroxybenzoate polyprenyltransferase